MPTRQRDWTPTTMAWGVSGLLKLLWSISLCRKKNSGEMLNIYPFSCRLKSIFWSISSLLFFRVFSLCSKQNQLWTEGVEFYKGKAFSKAEPHLYGIYSIKQRELKSTNGNGLQTTNTITNTAKGNLMRIINPKRKMLHIQFSFSKRKTHT